MDLGGSWRGVGGFDSHPEDNKDEEVGDDGGEGESCDDVIRAVLHSGSNPNAAFGKVFEGQHARCLRRFSREFCRHCARR